MDDSTPNYDENYQVNEEGKLEKWAGKIVSVELKDENGKFIKDLDVADCKTYKEIRRKRMESLWAYFENEGLSSEDIIGILRKKTKHNPKEFTEFLEEKL